jgi:hypothetical protein
VTDFLDDTSREITARLEELKPLVDEYHRLESAVAALDGIASAPTGASASSSPSTPARRGPGRPRGSGTTTAAPASTPAPPKTSSTGKPAAKRRRRRRKGLGGRAAQAIKLIRAEPGITIPSLSEKMGVKSSYLYRILPPLGQAGKIRKAGRGWFPKQAA